MRNNGDQTFTDVTPGSGIGTAKRGVDNHMGDFNNDGFVDIASNGSILYSNGDLTFVVDNSNPTADGASGDIDNNGFLDLFNGSLYVNQTNSNNWIKINTIGDHANGKSNINGIGARLEINTSSGTQIRDVMSGTGFKYMSSLNSHFGIGSDTSINYLRIYWPSGTVDNITNPNINETITVREGQTLSADDFQLDKLSLYPNPTNGVLNLDVASNQLNSAYSIYDITGKIVLRNKLLNKSIDVSALSSGTYILKLVSDQNVYTQKFIKN
jgi:hypothetical protein